MSRWWVIALGIPLLGNFKVSTIEPKILYSFLLGLLWAALTLIDTPHPHAGALDLYFLSLFGLIAIAASNVEDISIVFKGMTWGIGVSSIVCILQALGLSSIPFAGRPSGLFINPEVLAELTAPLWLWAACKKKWFLAILLAIPLGFCHSRIAFLVIVFGLIYNWKPKNTLIKGSLIACLIPLSALTIAINLNKLYSAYDRFMLWWAAVESITPFGRGLAWWAASHPYAMQDFAHSDILQSFDEIGLGTFFFLAIPFFIFKQSKPSPERTAFFGILIETAVSFPIHVPATGFLAALLAGWLSRSGGLICEQQPTS